MIDEITKEKPKFKILKSPNLKRKQKKKFVPLNERIKLETVLGLSVTSNAGLSLDSHSGNVAYFAGCVAVLYNPRKNKQFHLFNSSKKPLSCLSFSGDGKYLATGESGHQPAVRVWDLEEMTQVSEFDGHKFGIRCVAFSPNLKYIVSVGYQHDMVVNVWNWKKNIKVASNKVASKVMDVAFSEDGSMFVTVGSRHVKFWYLNASKSKNQLETLPLLGRNGILGEHQNNMFCGVCCGRPGGDDNDYVYAITDSGLLCQFNDRRVLTKWVSLKTNKATALSMGNGYIFVGCSGGLVRVFNSLTLNFIASLPLPHPLGVDVAINMQGQGDGADRTYADTIAVRYDPTNNRLCSVYDDRSFYVWDVTDIKKIGKTRSFLCHSGAVWGVDIFPVRDSTILPNNSFATCGNDNTIRFWRLQSHNNNHTTSTDGIKKNIFSNELIKVLYVDKDLSNLRDLQFNQAANKTDPQDKNGIRCIKFRPDGKQLASGDRVGNIRIHDLESMIQLTQIEAHDSEVLSLEYTSPETGLNLLVSGSRDRLVHVFDAQNDYNLIQTLDEHSAAVTAVKFVTSDLQLGLISCSADKSILFRTANVDPTFHFSLARHVVSRTTLYDMEVDASKKFVAIACQDRNIRIYNMRTGKMKKCYGGSTGTEGILLRLQFDPTSSFVATCSSDKTIALFNFFTGECCGHMMGHSEVPTGLKFFEDLGHLATVGADGCVFVWKMDSELTEQMTKRHNHLREEVDVQQMRRTTFNISDPPTTSEPEDKLNGLADDNSFVFRFSPGQLPSWARTKFSKESSRQQSSSSPTSMSWNVPLAPKGRWAQNVNTQNYPLPPSLPYLGWKDFIKTEESSSGVPIIREGDDDDPDVEEDVDDDEFSMNQSHQNIAIESPKTEDDENALEGDDEDDDDDDGGVDSNDNDDEMTKEEPIFLPPSEPFMETCLEKLFKVEENSLIRLNDGSGENENYLSSYEEDVDLKSVPSSPTSSSEQPHKSLDSFPLHDEGVDISLKKFDLSQETFEMTLKRLEVEMSNRSQQPRDRCSLSAKYFNSSSNNNNNSDNSNDNINNNSDNSNDNINNNNDVEVNVNNDNNNNTTTATSTMTTKLSTYSMSTKRDLTDDFKKRQLINGQISKPGMTGSLGRRQGRSLAGSELRLAVNPNPMTGKPIEKSKLRPSSSTTRKWKSLVDIRVDDGEAAKGVTLSPDMRAMRTSVGGGFKLKSILRSQTPNITMNLSDAVSNSWGKKESSFVQNKQKKSTLAVSTTTLKQEMEPKKSIVRVRSYRMSTESSQAKQQSSSSNQQQGSSSNQQQISSSNQQQGRRLLPRSTKQFQSTPNLTKEGAPLIFDDSEEQDKSELFSLTIAQPQSSVSISDRVLQANKELETLDEEAAIHKTKQELRGFSSNRQEVRNVTPGLLINLNTSSSNEDVHLNKDLTKVGEEIELPERDLSSTKRVHSSIGYLKPFNQTSRPLSSNIHLKSQLQRRLLPTEPSNNLSASHIEPCSMSSTKILQLKEISNIDSNIQKPEDPTQKRVVSQSKWGSLRSPTNINITFARPPSRNLHVRSPDPLQNWVQRAETIQHQWELRNNETSENGQANSAQKFGSEGSRRWSSVQYKRSESTESVESQDLSSPTRTSENEFPISGRSRRSSSSLNFDWQARLEDKNRLKHGRTSSADGNYQSDEALPREGEPISNLKDSQKIRKDGMRPRVGFSPVVCMMSNETTSEEEVCERLKEAVNSITRLYEEMREFREPDDPVLSKLRLAAQEGCNKLQPLIGPPQQSSSQLDRCAEDLTMKMYELIRKKIDFAPTTF